MLEKIKMLPLMAYLAVHNFVEDLKNDEKGSSPVVDTVLLILVAVLAASSIIMLLPSFSMLLIFWPPNSIRFACFAP